MSRKIIGVTVGSPLPKSNLKQTDPAKGDYVKGKDIIPTKVSELENDAGYLKECQCITVTDDGNGNVVIEIGGTGGGGDIESDIAVLDDAILDISVLA